MPTICSVTYILYPLRDVRLFNIRLFILLKKKLMRTKSFIALICLIFSGLLSLPHSFAITNGQEVEDIPLHNEAPPGNIPHAPALIPISCFYISSLGCVAIQSSSIVSNAHVLIINTSTGFFSEENIVIDAIPSLINLFGPGSYYISITLSSGAEYYGSFCI